MGQGREGRPIEDVIPLRGSGHCPFARRRPSAIGGFGQPRPRQWPACKASRVPRRARRTDAAAQAGSRGANRIATGRQAPPRGTPSSGSPDAPAAGSKEPAVSWAICPSPGPWGAVAGWGGRRAGRAPPVVQPRAPGCGSRCEEECHAPPGRPANDDPTCSSGATPPTERRYAVRAGAGGRRSEAADGHPTVHPAMHASGRNEALSPRGRLTRQRALADSKVKHADVKK